MSHGSIVSSQAGDPAIGTLQTPHIVCGPCRHLCFRARVLTEDNTDDAGKKALAWLCENSACPARPLHGDKRCSFCGKPNVVFDDASAAFRCKMQDENCTEKQAERDTALRVALGKTPNIIPCESRKKRALREMKDMI